MMSAVGVSWEDLPRAFLTQNHSLAVSLQGKTTRFSLGWFIADVSSHILHLWGQPVSVFAAVREEVLGLGRSKRRLARALLWFWPDQPGCSVAGSWKLSSGLGCGGQMMASS